MGGSGASQVVLVVKNLPADAGDMRHRFDPWVGKIPWRRAWQPTPVFLPGESHGQRSLVGYSPCGHKEAVTKSWTQLKWLSTWVVKKQTDPFFLLRDLEFTYTGSQVLRFLKLLVLNYYFLEDKIMKFRYTYLSATNTAPKQNLRLISNKHMKDFPIFTGHEKE